MSPLPAEGQQWWRLPGDCADECRASRPAVVLWRLWVEVCSSFSTQVLDAAVGFKVSCQAEDFRDLGPLGRGCGGSELAEGQRVVHLETLGRLCFNFVNNTTIYFQCRIMTKMVSLHLLQIFGNFTKSVLMCPYTGVIPIPDL